MDRDIEQRILDLERTVASLQDQLRTFTSSPKNTSLGSKQMAFEEQFFKGNGHVVRVVPNSIGDGLTVKKVQ